MWPRNSDIIFAITHNECSNGKKKKKKDQMQRAYHQVNVPQCGTYGPTLGVSLSNLQGAIGEGVF